MLLHINYPSFTSQPYAGFLCFFLWFRYGGYSFGLVREDIPENFGKSGPTQFRKLAVRHATLVCCFVSITLRILVIFYASDNAVQPEALCFRAVRASVRPTARLCFPNVVNAIS